MTIEIKHINWSVAGLILVANAFFIIKTIEILMSGGGAMGYGLLILPITVLINLLIITAILIFKEKFKNSSRLLILNTLGLVWIIFWLFTFLTNG